MGIDIAGLMIVGCHISNTQIEKMVRETDSNIWDWCDHNGINIVNPWYDCPEDELYVGYIVKNIQYQAIPSDFIETIETLGDKFRDLCGVIDPTKIRFMGIADVC